MNISIPTSWNDLTIRQSTQFALLFHKDTRGFLFDYRVLFILMNIRWWQFWKYRKLTKTLHNVKLADLKQYYDWVYKEVGLTKFPVCVKGNRKLQAPKDRLTNLTIEELAVADDLFLGWYKTKKREYLEYLTALLYWDVKDTKRTAFDKTELEDRAKVFKKVSISNLLLIAITYQGCKTHITNQFPIVFPRSSNKTTKKNVKLPQSSGFGKLILQLSGQKFGTHNETKQTNIYTFLSEVSEQIKENKDLKK